MLTSTSLEQTESFAHDFLHSLVLRNSATVVGLYGDLGSGKTAFTKGIAKALGITDTVTSPTFVIEKIYKITSHPHFTHLIHIDAYRLEKSSEIVSLGWNEIISDPHNLICIEWPERVLDIMPTDHIALKFTFVDENTRLIERTEQKK